MTLYIEMAESSSYKIMMVKSRMDDHTKMKMDIYGKWHGNILG